LPAVVSDIPGHAIDGAIRVQTLDRAAQTLSALADAPPTAYPQGGVANVRTIVRDRWSAPG
jgi:hypothetical protein